MLVQSLPVEGLPVQQAEVLAKDIVEPLCQLTQQFIQPNP